MARSELKDKLLKDFDAKVSEVNQACAKGTNADVEGKLQELGNIETQYRSLRESEVFAGLMDPHEAIERHHFTTIGHKKLTSDGRMTGVERSDRTVQIDLRKFCEVRGFDLEWFYELQALNKRLTLKVAEGLGVSASEMKKIDDSYSMDKLASEIELGKTPTSNTQIVKHMQRVLDLLSPGEGRIENRDLAYVLGGYTKRDSKKALTLQCSKHSMLQSLMGDVFYRIATKDGYGASYKRSNDPVVAGESSEKQSKPASAPKTKAEVAKAEVSKPKAKAESAAPKAEVAA